MSRRTTVVRATLGWAALATATGLPIYASAVSPLLAWRDPIYIVAGLAGVVALALLLVQPLAAGGYLPGLTAAGGRRLNRALGVALVALVIMHVAALWITSPPDVVDALLFASPTPFAAWGVIAMWAVFASGLLVAFRRKLRLTPALWRVIHTMLALVIVVGSVVHAALIDGTMEQLSKLALCVLVLAVTAKVIARVWVQASRTRR
ncbi:ferric reductase [Tabrizicola piscis]|uniref:Ferric reductase n=1 Tax=Tabrizicola piscis TaxID=2494374 RepID=A0A3S8U7I5_9RHOB|nr:ferric reductase [Tabrizicola piscis]AZL59571.1 ferric reductase [Tabrizicola piscis]